VLGGKRFGAIGRAAEPGCATFSTAVFISLALLAQFLLLGECAKHDLIHALIQRGLLRRRREPSQQQLSRERFAEPPPEE
jgi:hypothetical protein